MTGGCTGALDAKSGHIDCRKQRLMSGSTRPSARIATKVAFTTLGNCAILITTVVQSNPLFASRANNIVERKDVTQDSFGIIVQQTQQNHKKISPAFTGCG